MMNKISLLSNGLCRMSAVSRNNFQILSPASGRWFSDEKSKNNHSSDSEETKENAKNKLNELLNVLKVSGANSNDNVESKVDSKLAKPKYNKPVKRDKAGKLKSEVPSAKELDNEMVIATKDVASLSGQKVKTESELVRKLKQLEKDTKVAKRENEVSGESQDTLESVFSSIRVEKPLSKQNTKIAGRLEDAKDRSDLSMEQVAFLQKRAKMRRAMEAEKLAGASVELNSGIPLGIFSGPMAQKDADAGDKQISFWRACHKRELSVLSTPPPRNALEEMILQTKQGKLWHFPVDNEQGLIYSDDPFYNHVFLEHHLDPWCPKSGPVRHFMEVLCMGLSQNPYYSSEKKKETILWFKDYFERPENHEILIHSGCWEDAESTEEASN